MKPTPSPFRSLLWVPAGVVIAPLLWLIIAPFGELAIWPILLVLLVFVSLLAFRFVRQLDEVEGPFPRSKSKDERAD